MSNREIMKIQNNRLVIDEQYLPDGIGSNLSLGQVLQNGNSTGGVDIDATSSNISTNTLNVSNIRPLGFPIIESTNIEGNINMVGNSSINF